MENDQVEAPAIATVEVTVLIAELIHDGKGGLCARGDKIAVSQDVADDLIARKRAR